MAAISQRLSSLLQTPSHTRSQHWVCSSHQAGCSYTTSAPHTAPCVPRALPTQHSRKRRLRQLAAAEQSAPGSTLSSELRTALEKFITEHKIVLFMKGNKQFPQCGFSNTCVQIFNMMNVPYETVNILEDDSLRMGMKEFSQWPTFPQVYIDGEFYGGCDIMIESFQSGELQEMLEASLNS